MTLPVPQEPRAALIHSPDAPLRLAAAASVAFPDGSMTASGLRKEAARGRLTIERIAGKDYTTLRAIEEMRQLCRVLPSRSASGSNQPGTIQTARSAIGQPGSSSAEDGRSAQDALRTIVRGPKKHSAATSRNGASKARASGAELMAVTGHQSLEEVDTYIREARRSKMADGGFKKLREA